jgi:hypothetical protein
MSLTALRSCRISYFEDGLNFIVRMRHSQLWTCCCTLNTTIVAVPSEQAIACSLKTSSRSISEYSARANPAYSALKSTISFLMIRLGSLILATTIK